MNKKIRKLIIYLKVYLFLEIDEMIEKYSLEKGDTLIGLDFNLPIINILWQMVASSRYRNNVR